ncbi:hypothetical protein CEXT_80781 [Caerostris extrusa]|uniref:Uncharacterized protein n=1 Tax=Caerostris extrusa TaxID=172846 RepID=A0AAV4P3K2_CAEEX|nr:hypothetical protein CEXT_80781 [Caerostris extrusa]
MESQVLSSSWFRKFQLVKGLEKRLILVMLIRYELVYTIVRYSVGECIIMVKVIFMTLRGCLDTHNVWNVRFFPLIHPPPSGGSILMRSVVNRLTEEGGRPQTISFTERTNLNNSESIELFRKLH